MDERPDRAGKPEVPMKLATACVAAAILLAGCARNVATPPAEEEGVSGPAAEAPKKQMAGGPKPEVPKKQPSLMALPDFRLGTDEFRSDPYIVAAVRLQAMERAAATATLRELAWIAHGGGSAYPD